MSLVHGSRGLIYFVHQFEQTFNEASLLDDPKLLASVTAINRQIHELAPVLNAAGGIQIRSGTGTAPDRSKGPAITSEATDVPLTALVTHHADATYVFGVSLANAPTRASVSLPAASEG